MGKTGTTFLILCLPSRCDLVKVNPDISVPVRRVFFFVVKKTWYDLSGLVCVWTTPSAWSVSWITRPTPEADEGEMQAEPITKRRGAFAPRPSVYPPPKQVPPHAQSRSIRMYSL